MKRTRICTIPLDYLVQRTVGYFRVEVGVDGLLGVEDCRGVEVEIEEEEEKERKKRG